MITNVNVYDSVYIQNIYKGIDLRINFIDNNFRYDFIVRKGASPEAIKMKISDNAKLLNLNKVK